MIKNEMRIVKIISITFILVFFTLLFYAETIIAADDGFPLGEKEMDIILVIDESGSMRQNDPDNERIDAAKLFVELNEVLTEGNRISVVGFGEETNIYIEPAETGKKKTEILEAISSIKSNQSLTDMKLALEEVKSMLDERVKRNPAVIIFLTDGELSIDDIPVPEEIYGEEEAGKKPLPPVKDDGSIEADPEFGSENEKETGPEDTMNEYLEDYKSELLDLCYSYKEDKIQIFPIAFTDEANIEILEQIAGITQARSWKSETAADIRDVFLEIFKYITNIFIETDTQGKGEELTGNIEVDDYIDKLIVIALSNDNESIPDIRLNPPIGREDQNIDKINGPTYMIDIIENPAEGLWDYGISGDMVLALDMARISLIDPVKAVYHMDYSVPVIMKLFPVDDYSGDFDPSDFKLSCDIRSPGDYVYGRTIIQDDGQGIDTVRDDGIFSYLFLNADEPGVYKIELRIDHTPTGASSLKEIFFTVSEKQTVKKDIYLKVENNIITDTSTIIVANFADFSEGRFSYMVTGDDGSIISGDLFDNGMQENMDQLASDGIYSNTVEGLSRAGKYTIKVIGEYKDSEGYDLSGDQEVIIGKYILIEEPVDVFQVNNKDSALEIRLAMDSIYDQDLGIRVMPRDKDVIDRIELDRNLMEAGVSMDLGMTIYFADGLEKGDYVITIPLVLGNVFRKDITLKVLYETEIPVMDLKTLAGLILVFISLIPLIFLLYSAINQGRLKIDIRHPRIILESSLFILFLAAGIIVLLL